MNDFLKFAEANGSKTARKKTTLARLWQRPGGSFTSAATCKGETFWVSNNQLLRGEGVSQPLASCQPVADLAPIQVTDYDTKELVPALRGVMNGHEILVRINTLAQKQAQVERAKAQGREHASLSTQADVYIQIFSYDIGGKAPKAESPLSEELEF